MCFLIRPPSFGTVFYVMRRISPQNCSVIIELSILNCKAHVRRHQDAACSPIGYYRNPIDSLLSRVDNRNMRLQFKGDARSQQTLCECAKPSASKSSSRWFTRRTRNRLSQLAGKNGITKEQAQRALDGLIERPRHR